jgi:hypothetical protein
MVAGERGGQKFDEVLSAPRPVRLVAMPAAPTTARDPSPGPAAPADRQSSLPAGGAGEAWHVCERWRRASPPGLRSEARYCSKSRDAGEVAPIESAASGRRLRARVLTLTSAVALLVVVVPGWRAAASPLLLEQVQLAAAGGVERELRNVSTAVRWRSEPSPSV